ncbi:MAG: hypothetical protein LBG98_02765 [Puniceicoccales bacterium]|jgi:hypothetical protein|nr:hypothetical protein [Puniceicoccales bacterium]
MTLSEAELIFGTIFLLLGTAFLCFPAACLKLLHSGMRSQTVNYACFVPAVSWFLWHIFHLRESDFGQYKVFFFIFFAAVGLIALLHLRDFLSIRGICIFALLGANELLQAAYMEETASRLWMVFGIYFTILLSIYLGTWPYRFRDFIDWFREKKDFFYPRFLGALLAIYGCVVLATLFW